MELFIERTYALYGTNLRDSFYASVNKAGLEVLQAVRLPAKLGLPQALI